MNASGINPVDVKVLVKPDPALRQTAGGLHLPDTTIDKSKYAATEATLTAVGPNAFKEWGGSNRPSPGDRVLFAQYSGARHKGQDGEDYIVMNDEDIISTLGKPNV